MAGHGLPKKSAVKRSVDDYQDVPPPPPDGGWGWVVVFGSFMIHVINDGITYSFGIFYDKFVDYFEEGKGKTALITSLLVGVTLCSGPISSALVNRYGCRKVTIMGAILSTLGMIASVFATNVTTLIFTIGVVTGFGFGLVYLPAIVCVTIYFEKKRSLATGIAVCGSGFGNVIYAPFISYLIDEYEWRGTMLICSATVLECMIFGALFRPIERLTRLPSKKTQEGGDIGSEADIILEERDAFIQHTLKEENGQPPKKALLSRSMHSVSSGMSRASAKSRGSLYRPDVFYQRSISNIPQQTFKSLQSLPTSSRRTYVDEKDEYLCGCIPWGTDTRELLKGMLDCSLLRDPVFLVFLLSNFLTSIGCNIPYVFIVPRGKVLEIEEVSYFLSIIGAANTVGRIVLGFICDKPWVNRLYVYNVCLMACGAAVFVSAFCQGFVVIAICLATFGFCFGAYVGLTSVILVDLLGLEKLTNAFGLVLLIQGVASLAGPPMAGALYDLLQLYEPAFYLSGATVFLSGLILFLVIPIQKYINYKAKKQLKDQQEVWQLLYNGDDIRFYNSI